MSSKHSLCGEIALLGLLLFGKLCLGQVMQFSVYNDSSISSDGTTAYNGVSVVDSSSCYSHSGYMTTAQIYTPDSRSASSQNPGLTANVSIAFNDVSGDWSFVGTGTYYCGCSFQNSGYGGGTTKPLRKTAYALWSWSSVSVG